MNPRRWGIRARSIVLLLATLLPLAGLGVYWALTETQDERARLEHEARELAALVAAQVEGRTAVVHEMLAVLEELPALRDGDRRAADRLIQTLLPKAPHLESIVLADAAGAVVAGLGPPTPVQTTSVGDRAWFQTAFRSGQPTVSGFQTSPRSGEPVVVVAHPVRGREGRIAGVIAASLRLTPLRQALVLDQADLSFIRVPVIWTVVDERGMVLLHSDPRVVAGAHVGPLPGTLRVEVPVATTGWRAILGLPEALATVRARQPLLTIGLPAGLILLAAAGVGVWIARSTWRPLHALGVAVRRIAAGETPAQQDGPELPTEAGGEVGEVARAFGEALTALTRRQQELAASLEANAQLYETIREHAALLEQRVQERTRELEEARRQAEAVSRFKSEFLANMSHELSAPLNAIIGFSEQLLAGGVGRLSEAQGRHVASISRAGEHLKELISDVLDLTRVEWGKLTLRLEPLRVPAVLKDVLAISRALASKKAQDLQIDIAPFLPPLWADPVRFKQICYNLLSNAVKFTPKGGRIAVAARLVDRSNLAATAPSLSREGPFLELTVRDTGIGIRAEDMPRLFEVFVQLDASTTERQEGTGLGLALTKRLVELHGGVIWAESAGEGRGSIFTVLLPLGGAPPGQRERG